MKCMILLTSDRLKFFIEIQMNKNAFGFHQALGCFHKKLA